MVMEEVRQRYVRKFKTEKQIRLFFEKQRSSVFAIEELRGFIIENGADWGLGTTTPTDKHVERFVKNALLRVVEIPFNTGKKYTRYIYKEATPLQIAVSLHSKAYLTHYTAVYLNGLTNQIPKTIYTSVEQSSKLLHRDQFMEQSAIDHAFSQPQRRSENAGVYEDYTIILLSGMHTNRTGVNLAAPLPCTGLERTLIDITVRPNYAGGAFAVLETYKRALEQRLSINKLVATLDKINYLYPYHQSIGFLLEKAGYSSDQLALLKNKSMPFNFYLDYNMQETDYSPAWRLYFPKGM
jgi:predicted transcriptional regulator of viral defense system